MATNVSPANGVIYILFVISLFVARRHKFSSIVRGTYRDQNLNTELAEGQGKERERTQ